MLLPRFTALALGAFMTTAAGAAQAEVTIDTATGPVTFAEVPQRVAVYDVAAIDTLAALGVDMVAVPDNILVTYLDEATAGLPGVGTLFEPNLEALAATAPDLIIVGGRSAAQAESLSRVAPVIDMTLTGDNLATEALARLDAYGTLFDREEAATELAAAFTARLNETRAVAAEEGRALVIMTNGPKVSAYGPGSRYGWIHHELGLIPAVDIRQDSSHGEAISFEFIREANPDWLIVVDRAAAIGEAGERAQQTLDNALVRETTAWREGQVVYLNSQNIYVAGGGYHSMMQTMDQLLAAFAD